MTKFGALKDLVLSALKKKKKSKLKKKKFLNKQILPYSVNLVVLSIIFLTSMPLETEFSDFDFSTRPDSGFIVVVVMDLILQSIPLQP